MSAKKKTGRGLFNRAIGALPIELHIPGYQFCGPGTRLQERLARGDPGVNPLDAACREHDIAYSRSAGLTERHAADKILAERALGRVIARDSALGERAAATAVWAAMKAKTKLGMGLKIRKKTRTKKKSTKKRILPTAKRGGVLPILPLLGILGSLAGGAAGITTAVNASKAARRQLEETQRHNRAMEGRGLYLAPYKYGQGLYLGPHKRGRGVALKINKKKKNVKKALNIPAGITTNVQLSRLARQMRVPFFRGVFMRNSLPIVDGVRRNESGIVNLDDATGPGTHWVAYAKRGDRVLYFDSFGNLRPPKELVRYFGPSVTKIEYNHTSYQHYDQNICGQLCLQFLRTIDDDRR